VILFSIKAMKQNISASLDVYKEFGLEVNAERTKYMCMSRHQRAKRNHDLMIASNPCVS
jgi:hypothetical protein